MVKSEEIIKEVVFKSSALNIGNLERQYNKIKKELGSKNIGSLGVKDLKTILAFEYLKDGAETNFIEEVLKSKESKVHLLKQLEIFGY